MLAAVEAFLSLPLSRSPVRSSQPAKPEEIFIASLCEPVGHRHGQLSWASCTGGSPIWQTSGCSSEEGPMRREDHLGAAPITLAGTGGAPPTARLQTLLYQRRQYLMEGSQVPRAHMDRCILTACPSKTSQRRAINPPASRPEDHALALPSDCVA